jgi:hypothetical protein
MTRLRNDFGSLLIGVVVVVVSVILLSPAPAHAQTRAPMPSVVEDLVPDHVAYTVLLRVVGSKDLDRRRVAYLRRIFTSSTCDTQPTANEERSRAVATILHKAGFHRERLAELDLQATQVRLSRAANMETLYAELNRRKRDLALHFRADLQANLSPEAFAAVDSFVQGHLKGRIRRLR